MIFYTYSIYYGKNKYEKFRIFVDYIHDPSYYEEAFVKNDCRDLIFSNEIWKTKLSKLRYVGYNFDSLVFIPVNAFTKIDCIIARNTQNDDSSLNTAVTLDCNKWKR